MKMTGTLLVSLILLNFSLATADQNSLLAEKPELLATMEHEPLLKAELLKKHELYAEAEKIITKAIEDDVREFRGEAAEMDRKVGTGEYSLSLSYLYYSRADCWYYLEQFDKALADYLESYQLKKNPDLLYDIGYCFYKEQNADDAIRTFDQYLATANPIR
jgi:tetratricopeptide (TPR) repeat protein